MPKKLHIQNVQSHVDTLFEFVPGINACIGPSDVGKSVVIRSLDSVIENKQPGDGFIRHGTKKSTIVLDDVTKIKSTSKNVYKLGDDTFKAIRSSVPPEISNHLKLTSVNFQRQHDPYFLIGESSGKVARTLNQVADLQVIDETLTIAKRKVKEAKNTKDNLKESLAVKQGEVADLQLVTDAN